MTIHVKIDDNLVPGITRLIECAGDVVEHARDGNCPWLIDELATALNRVIELNSKV